MEVRTTNLASKLLPDSNIFFLRLRSGEKRKEGESDGVGERDFGKGGGEPKIHVQNAKLACARHARVQCFHVFVFTSSPLGYISLKNSILGVKASPLFSFTLCSPSVMSRHTACRLVQMV